MYLERTVKDQFGFVTQTLIKGIKCICIMSINCMHFDLFSPLVRHYSLVSLINYK